MSDPYQQGHRDGSTQGAAAADVITELTGDRDRLRVEVEGLTTRLREADEALSRNYDLRYRLADVWTRLEAVEEERDALKALLEKEFDVLWEQSTPAALVGEPLPPKKDAENV